MRIAYADPPYPGCANLYRDHADYAGEVDHRALVEQIEREFDGWVLHTHVKGLRMMEREQILPLAGIRICQWVKPFASFKPGNLPAYAYEPVIVKAARKPQLKSGRLINRDWISEPITMRRGLTGAKPERVCHWAFELVGAEPEDDLCDLFPDQPVLHRTGRVLVVAESHRTQLQQLAARPAHVVDIMFVARR
jgi:hypothetical protein